MTGRPMRRQKRKSTFVRNDEGASAVEFALLAMPFIMLLLALPQMAVYFMTQSSLDAGTVKAAETLTNSYNGAAAPATMTPAALKALVVGNSGGLVHDDATLAVELRHVTALAAGPAPVGNTVETSAPRDVMAIRTSASVITFVPYLGTLSVQSSAIVRRGSL